LEELSSGSVPEVAAAEFAVPAAAVMESRNSGSL
jgi:hypothetical protein